MTKILWLALGGAAGTLARVGLSALVQHLGGVRFPWGTLSVNLLGCLLFGLVWAVTEDRARFGPEVRMFVLAGFMGAFTTFSTYIFDTGELVRTAHLGAAVANVALQNVLGLLCLFAGFALGRAF